MTTYNTTQDFINQTFPEDLGDGTRLTHDQEHEIAEQMLVWHDEYTPSGDINLNESGFVEREDVDFWELVQNTLDDN